MGWPLTGDPLGFLPPAPGGSGTGGITVGAAVSGGTAGRVLFEGAGPVIADAAGFAYATASGITLSTDDATTAASLAMLTLEHTSSGTAAPGFGTGILFKAESAGGTSRSLSQIDAVYSTATDAAEVSSVAFKTMLAGALTETMRLGTGAALPDADVSFSMGRVLIDSRQTDSAFFSHRDMTATTNFALRATAVGATMVNGASGQTVSVAINGSSTCVFDATSIAPTGTVKHKWPSGNEQTTVGAAGGASALPATPTKYLKILDSAGTTLVIPAYAAV